MGYFEQFSDTNTAYVDLRPSVQRLEPSDAQVLLSALLANGAEVSTFNGISKQLLILSQHENGPATKSLSPLKQDVSVPVLLWDDIDPFQVQHAQRYRQACKHLQARFSHFE
jgi:hypothetical protein